MCVNNNNIISLKQRKYVGLTSSGESPQSSHGSRGVMQVDRIGPNVFRGLFLVKRINELSNKGQDPTSSNKRRTVVFGELVRSSAK